MPPPLIRISSLSCSPPNSSPNRPTSLPLPLPLILIKKNHLRPLSSLPLLSRPLRRCRNRRLATRSSVSFLKTSAAPGLPRASSRGCSSSCPAVTSGISSRLRRKKNRSVSMSALTNERSLPIMAGLGRMWMLVAKDRWIITIAFASLFFASVILMMQLSDISIPHFLAASIFSAQSGESITFYRNAKILVLLCFFIRNMRWLARLLLWYCKYDTDEAEERERLYQDMFFF